MSWQGPSIMRRTWINIQHFKPVSVPKTRDKLVCCISVHQGQAVILYHLFSLTGPALNKAITIQDVVPDTCSALKLFSKIWLALWRRMAARDSNHKLRYIYIDKMFVMSSLGIAKLLCVCKRGYLSLCPCWRRWTIGHKQVTPTWKDLGS